MQARTEGGRAAAVWESCAAVGKALIEKVYSLQKVFDYKRSCRDFA